jgi:hypothetical protein
VDPEDRLDPASAQSSGVDLGRFLWLRGRTKEGLPRVLAATSTLLGSGLFDLVVLDLAATPPRDRQSLPAPSWIRLHRMIEGTPSSLLIVSMPAIARSPGGFSIELAGGPPTFSGRSGPGQLLARVDSEASLRLGRSRPVTFTRQAS